MEEDFMKKIFLILLLIAIVTSGFFGRATIVAQEASFVTIYHEGSASAVQMELISPKGVRVLIDVNNHELLSSPATAKDILLTSHGHSDHLLTSFYLYPMIPKIRPIISF